MTTETHPDPFERLTAIGSPRFARVLASRFIAGDSISALARAYLISRREAEDILRWALVRLQKRRSIR